MTEHITYSLNIPSYEDVKQSLEAFAANSGPSEAHGLMCGLLCAGAELDGQMMFAPIIGHIQAKDEESQYNRQILLDLYEFTINKMQGFEFDFQILLPDDDSALLERAAALTYWCQGFLSGLNLINISVEDAKTEDTLEAMQRILEIATLDYESITIEENEDEDAYMEITEYVRLAVLMIYSEFAKPATTAESGEKQLH